MFWIWNEVDVFIFCIQHVLYKKKNEFEQKSYDYKILHKKGEIKMLSMQTISRIGNIIYTIHVYHRGMM